MLRCRRRMVLPIAGIISLCLIFLVCPGCTGLSSQDSRDLLALLDKEDADPAFQVPRGHPDKILNFARDLQKRPPSSSDHQAQLIELVRIQKAMARAGAMVLTQNADEKSLTEATKFMVTGLLQIAMISADSSELNERNAKTALDAVDRLRKDRRPAVASTAAEFWVMARTLNMASMSPEQRRQLGDESIARVKAKPSGETVTDCLLISEQLFKREEFDQASSVIDRLLQSIRHTNDDAIQRLIPQIHGRAVGFRLLGKPLEIEGKMLGGGELNWESYRGKVVLIDFWATWCGPCLAELPAVKANYEKYHDQGFEVIGISLDRNRKQLEKFVEESSVPWPQLFDDSVSEGARRMHPMVEKFEISSIPTTFLVNREGIVVNIGARGDQLERMLKKLMPSAP